MKKQRPNRRDALSLLAAGTATVSLGSCGQGAPMRRREFQYQPGPADNPMKGFVPFASEWNQGFPHSMEWIYFPLNAVMSGPGRFDFDRVVEPALSAIAGRGNQAALRFYLDYPAKPSGVPSFLIDASLRMTAYEEHGGGLAPDYEDEMLIAALIDFVDVLGERYDSDGRVAFLTLGLLGFWGEWHTYPRSGLMASERIQRRLLDTFVEAFPKTPLLMRYPMADAMQWPVGLHDDSFVHSTIGDDDWQFMARIEAAGARDLWKTQAIGGEVRPELQPLLWRALSSPEGETPFQDYGECVRQTHASWLINQHVFNEGLPEAERQRAIQGAQQLGYDLFVAAFEFPGTMGPGKTAAVVVEIENRGVAPLYGDLPLEWELTGAGSGGGEPATLVQPLPRSLSRILPGKPLRWEASLEIMEAWPEADWQLRLKTHPPIEGGKALRFANATSEADGGLLLADSTGLGG